MKRALFLLILLLMIPTSAYAQVVINPTKAIFVASADHNVVENEVPVVTNYELRIYVAGGTVPLRTLNLNKPTPDTNNEITVTISTLVASLPVGDYFGKVAAKGPGGEAVSEPSNPFTVAVRPPTAPTTLRFTK